MFHFCFLFLDLSLDLVLVKVFVSGLLPVGLAFADGNGSLPVGLDACQLEGSGGIFKTFCARFAHVLSF